MYIWSIGVFDVDRPSLSNLTAAKLIFVNGLYIDRLIDKSFVTVIHLQALFVQDSYSARRQAINIITFDLSPCSVFGARNCPSLYFKIVSWFLSPKLKYSVVQQIMN